jgi:hypothetical protein
MIQALDNHSQTGFKYLLTSDESWMTYDLCYDTVDELQETKTSRLKGSQRQNEFKSFRRGQGDWRNASGKKESTLSQQNAILPIVFAFTHGKWVNPDT